MTGFTTKAIHTTDRDNPYGSILPPIYTTTTYAQPCDGTEGPYDYQRGGNPTRAALETTLATLEGAKHAFAYPSGMGATAAALGILKEGETLLLGMPSYGGTYRFATIELPARGVKTRFIGDFTALTDEDFTDNVTMVFLESPSNPLLRVSDIAAIAEIAHRNGAIVVVDNTFMTPLLQKPLDLGADISVQSATKYLGGHADLLGGVAATNDDALAERLWHLQMITGAMLSPTDSYRLLQEVKTLKLRLTQQQKNTIEVINYLEAHPAVKRVLYAGSHSEYEAQVHARQANGLGALISMELVDGADLPAFLEALKIFSHAASLGGIESLVVRPALMVQAAYTQAHRDEYGVSDNLIRLAIGIEEIEDIIEDLERGLTAALAHQA
ncbi:cystathionine gamma-synthase [Rothia sp. HMSC069C03]|jgi:cystathionine beta-lyase/cystathionine gamma-synthase|uniref:trans-sulfuration enzyme family protein n=1 Tax=Rothia sp. HMSC069C03 TaxID=1739283 RepID=UPI0008AAB085|nr:PLP-dependent aspartate aminotransferase family protein [Rothia sp. HMSC069C03]OFL20689.1 cystathionine gamma-synthase [Rothia sp. HMSC069C03]